ncbi:hypothetical protein [Helcococcus kunzii]|uniref:hypothetical protein n=1 Tax=Helcococcus kunzii TaxID=40091 RepID=UPI0024ACAEFE|nr:hypothetical protein [Helcococcus kunzii]
MKKTIIIISENEITTEVTKDENKTIVTVSKDNISLKADEVQIINIDANKIKSAPAGTDAENKYIY